MIPDEYTEVSSQSWFGRIGNSIKGFLFGIVLFLVAFPVLFLNEGRAVDRYRTLVEGGKTVVAIVADRIDPVKEGKLVHLTCEAKTADVIQDPVFGISANALRVKRIVEMYQWKEEKSTASKKKLGGGTEDTTTYKYQKEWSKELIRSSNFKHAEGHQNPAAVPYESLTKNAGKVELGAFSLSESLLTGIDSFEPLTVGENDALPKTLDGKCKIHDGKVYFGLDPRSPETGDVRVSFKVVNPGVVSVMSRQVGNSFEPYATKAGGTINLIESGVHTAEAMIKHEQFNNTLLTWILRAAGFVMMFVGLVLIFGVLTVLADVLPLLGDVAGVGTKLVAGLMAATFSITTIAIAWFYYRPLFGIALIAAAVGLIVLIRGKLTAARKLTAESAS